MRILAEDNLAADQARTRGSIYALLAWGWRYPDQEALAALGGLLARLRNPIWPFHADDGAANALDSMPFSTDGDLESQEMIPLYAELFGHAVRGTCPLYELEHGNAEIVQQAGELADIAGFYSAFGLENENHSLERVDHIAVECEFMSVLCAKQAMGVLSALPDLVERCCDAQRAFLRDHLARWMPALCSRVSKADPDGIYGWLARLGTIFIQAECAGHGVSSGPEYLELRTVDAQADSEIQCGTPASEQLVPLTIGESETS